MTGDIIWTSRWLNHPFEKYARQIGSIPPIGMKIKHNSNHYTLPETNIFAPENWWLEYFLVSFWGPAYFPFRECIGCIPGFTSTTEWQFHKRSTIIITITIKHLVHRYIPYTKCIFYMSHCLKQSSIIYLQWRVSTTPPKKTTAFWLVDLKPPP